MTHPDRENTLSLLGDWEKHHAAVVKLMDGIQSSLGFCPSGSTFFETVWALFYAYTSTLIVEVGDFDGWLEWYYTENEMGVGKRHAGYDKQLIAIASLEDLYSLIEISRERNQ